MFINSCRKYVSFINLKEISFDKYFIRLDIQYKNFFLGKRHIQVDFHFKNGSEFKSIPLNRIFAILKFFKIIFKKKELKKESVPIIIIHGIAGNRDRQESNVSSTHCTYRYTHDNCDQL